MHILKIGKFTRKLISFLLFIVILFSLYACQHEPYYITWKDSNGEIIDTQYIDSNVEVNEPSEPFKYGYNFVRWEKKPNNSTNDILYVAIFEIKDYTVTFKDDIGNIISIQSVKHGDNAEEPYVPYKFGYEFFNWDKSLLNIEKNTTISATYIRTFSQAEIHNLLKNSVFKVEILDKNLNVMSQGSGFFVKEDGTFITNAHVIEDGWYGRIDQDSNVFDIDIVQLIQYNSLYDYAILKVNNNYNSSKFKPVELITDYTVGETVYSIGYPQNSFSNVISKGKILNDQVYNGIPYIVTDAKISPGSSGGVTVNRFGQVIGITTYAFGNGTYGSVPTRIFENSINNNSFYSKTLKDYFHPTKLVSLYQFNFLNYFDISITNSDISFNSSGATIYYSVEVLPKIEILDVSYFISFTLSIKTNYTYTSFIFGNTYTYKGINTKNVYIDLYYHNDLTYQASVSTIIFNSNLQSLDTFSWDISSIFGSITIYE